jgi:cytochrome P450
MPNFMLAASPRHPETGMSDKSRSTTDFDHHSGQYAADPWRTAEKLASKCPVAWSEKHGGYWVISGYEQVREAARDSKTFSSRHDLPNGCSAFQGVNIPSVEGRYLPIELDPPEQLDWRRMLAPRFSPAMADKLRPMMEQFCTWNLDRHIESGEIDLVEGYTSAVPAMVTLHLLGLPLARWHTYVEMTHKINYTAGDNRARVFSQFDAMLREVVVAACTRRSEPQDDLLTTLVQMKVNGEPLSDEDIASACGTIIAGGIDTTSAVVAGSLQHLAENPALRQRLVASPELLPQAIEEFLRYISPVTGLGRTATRDVELGGQLIKAGDRVHIMWHGANMDGKVFADPTRVDVDRDVRGHVTFGYGAHRCLGSSIARADMPIMLRHILTRIPDFELIPGRTVRYPSIGVSNNYVSMPARFAPGKRVGVDPALEAALEIHT